MAIEEATGAEGARERAVARHPAALDRRRDAVIGLAGVVVARVVEVVKEKEAAARYARLERAQVARDAASGMVAVEEDERGGEPGPQAKERLSGSARERDPLREPALRRLGARRFQPLPVDVQRHDRAAPPGVAQRRRHQDGRLAAVGAD